MSYATEEVARDQPRSTVEHRANLDEEMPTPGGTGDASPEA